jgi:hypothetical protein
MSLVQCLGGWCNSRNRCAHYHAESRPGREPIERLCGAVEEPERITHIGRLPVDKSAISQPVDKSPC